VNTSTQSPAADLRRLIVGYRLSQALHVAAKLGIADLLKNGPRSVDELAQVVGAHPASLYRVMRLLASEGIFAEAAPGTFKLTPLAAPLQSDAPGSLRARAVFDCEEANWKAWGHLLHSVATGKPAFDCTHGTGLFEYLKKHAAAASSFNAMMMDQTAGWAQAVVEAYDFSDLGALVDVGGGYGGLLAAILAAQQSARGVLYDQPHVVADALPKLEAAGVATRCEIIGGDFFEDVPAGGDTYLLKHILHDWDEHRCGVILRNCRRAMPNGGRLLVIETLIPPGNEPTYGKYLDLNMLVLQRGRERTEAEYGKLLEATRFMLSRVIVTRSELSILEAMPV
jgi:ubiquinone/menaquinone biosynthesis C-methylase UbiE